MSDNYKVRTPPRLRQVWPPVEPQGQQRLGSRPDAKLRQVRGVLGWRSMRAEVLGSRLLYDPAWEVLLHIYAAELADCTTTLPLLAAAMETSASTLQRWVRALEDEGLIKQEPFSGPTPAAIRLTDHGIGGMHALFELLPARGSPSALSA